MQSNIVAAAAPAAELPAKTQLPIPSHKKTKTTKNSPAKAVLPPANSRISKPIKTLHKFVKSNISNLKSTSTSASSTTVVNSNDFVKPIAKIVKKATAPASPKVVDSKIKSRDFKSPVKVYKHISTNFSKKEVSSKSSKPSSIGLTVPQKLNIRKTSTEYQKEIMGLQEVNQSLLAQIQSLKKELEISYAKIHNLESASTGNIPACIEENIVIDTSFKKLETVALDNDIHEDDSIKEVIQGINDIEIEKNDDNLCIPDEVIEETCDYDAEEFEAGDVGDAKTEIDVDSNVDTEICVEANESLKADEDIIEDLSRANLEIGESSNADDNAAGHADTPKDFANADAIPDSVFEDVVNSDQDRKDATEFVTSLISALPTDSVENERNVDTELEELEVDNTGPVTRRKAKNSKTQIQSSEFVAPEAESYDFNPPSEVEEGEIVTPGPKTRRKMKTSKSVGDLKEEIADDLQDSTRMTRARSRNTKSGSAIFRDEDSNIETGKRTLRNRAV